MISCYNIQYMTNWLRKCPSFCEADVQFFSSNIQERYEYQRYTALKYTGHQFSFDTWEEGQLIEEWRSEFKKVARPIKIRLMDDYKHHIDKLESQHVIFASRSLQTWGIYFLGKYNKSIFCDFTHNGTFRLEDAPCIHLYAFKVTYVELGNYELTLTPDI